MAEVFEIVLFNKKQIGEDKILRFLQEINVNVSSLTSMDNWEYSNIKDIKLTDINSLVKEGKVVHLEGKMGEDYCGGFVSKTSSLLYEYELWISAERYTHLIEDNVSERTETIYDRIFETLKKYVKAEDLFICGMGIEIFMEDCGDVHNIVKESYGITQWIVSKEEKLRIKGFTEEVTGGFKRYSLRDGDRNSMKIDYEWYQYVFENIFEWCGAHVLELTDEKLLGVIYEEYMFYYVDLSDENLNAFVKKGFITKKLAAKAKQIRKLSEEMFSPEQEFSAVAVRNSERWQKIFSLVDELKIKLSF